MSNKRNRIQRVIEGDKRASFQNVASFRTQNVLAALDNLATCGDRARYESTKEEIDTIAAAIAKAAAEAIDTLRNGKSASGPTFKLGGK